MNEKREICIEINSSREKGKCYSKKERKKERKKLKYIEYQKKFAERKIEKGYWIKARKINHKKKEIC